MVGEAGSGARAQRRNKEATIAQVFEQQESELFRLPANQIIIAHKYKDQVRNARNVHAGSPHWPLPSSLLCRPATAA
jgi:hypothetical protein